MKSEEKIQALEAENAMLKATNAQLSERVKSLEDKVMYLLKQLEKQGIKKDSQNSHNPPSQDKAKPKRNQSLRPKTTRKTGGQPGHKGHTLAPKEVPDKEVDLKSDYCNNCGEDLSDLAQKLVSKRQVIELPPIEPLYIQYNQYGCCCPCGHHQKATYPKGVHAHIQYGSSVIALVSYLNVFQYVPYQRLQELLKDVFQLPLSQGTIENLLNKSAAKASPIYQAILDQIKSATCVGSDETGAKVNGKKWWIWVWQNLQNTFLKASNSRGFKTVEEILPDGLPNATIVSDRLAAQLKTTSKDKQFCLPHLFRDLNFLETLEQHNWVILFKQLLKQALVLRKIAVENKAAWKTEQPEVQQIEQQLNQLLAQCIDKKQFPQTCTFQKSMIKGRNCLFTFLYNLEVPPDNNASERAVRNVKVKQKISGQFKSGQDTFCTLRSIIDTLRKRQLNVLEYLAKIVAI